mgnify:CR=1 FL=1
MFPNKRKRKLFVELPCCKVNVISLITNFDKRVPVICVIPVHSGDNKGKDKIKVVVVNLPCLQEHVATGMMGACCLETDMLNLAVGLFELILPEIFKFLGSFPTSTFCNMTD